MSNPVLSQLATVENDLSQQAESLASQLAAIQEQQVGLRTVIDMFQRGDSADGSTQLTTANLAKSSSANKRSKNQSNKKESPPAKKALNKKRGRPPGKSSAKASATKSAKAKTTRSTTTKAKVSANAGSNTASKAARKKQKDGRAADWQKYAYPSYEDAALPEAVSTVLRSQPSEIFTIADVMSTIFVEDMPRDAFLKARNRISNILSAGARDGTWYRGRNGRYAQTENVTKGR